MSGHFRRRAIPTRLFLAFVLIPLAGCETTSPIGPGGIPDVSGFWSGQYMVTGCTLSNASDPFFCRDAFPVRASLILETDLVQNGDALLGVMGQGTLQGDVEGLVGVTGIVRLGGVLGSDTLTTSEILGWQTGLVGDSLVGSWRFEVIDHGGRGFGTAVVDASIRLLGASVPKLFGCPVQGQLPINNQVIGDLHVGDCEFADASFFDVYSFQGTAGDSVEIALRSPSFDAFLIVTDEDENELGSDDDSGGGAGGTDAALTVVFDAAGTVLVAANSATAGEVGPYTLSATSLIPIVASARSPSARAPGAPVARVVSGDRSGKMLKKTRPRLLRVRSYEAAGSAGALRGDHEPDD